MSPRFPTGRMRGMSNSTRSSADLFDEMPVATELQKVQIFNLFID